ncbi:MAG: IS110 family transposase [Cyanobacteria bacterium P01_E01_bin.34]
MKKSTHRISYRGADVFVGVDVHKKSYSVVARADKTVIKKWTTVASPQKFTDLLLSYFEGASIHTAYEASFSAFVLHRELVRQGINSIVVHVPSIEVAANDRVKTDKRDAHKLAVLLEAGRLKGIRIPTEAEEHRRLLTRTRQQLVAERTAIRNKLRMKFPQFGLLASDDTRQMSHSLVREILTRSPSTELTISVEAYWALWKSLDEQLSKLELALLQQANEDPNEQTYRSAPGIGKISARVLANELGNMSQFRNERQLFCFTGLTPSEYSTGDRVRRGHITQQGNSRVRAILVEIAWRAVKEDRALASCFERLSPRTGKKRAIVAVARKLIGRIRAAFRQGQLYRLGYQV